MDIDGIAYSLLALFLRLYGLEPLPAEAWDRREHGRHIVWTVPANIRPDCNTPGFCEQLSCSLWEYIENYNDLKVDIKFQPYDVEDYGTSYVYVSICQ